MLMPSFPDPTPAKAGTRREAARRYFMQTHQPLPDLNGKGGSKAIPQRRRPRRISPPRARQLKQYKDLRSAFLSEHKKCEHPCCSKPATDVHHTRGRAGKMLLLVQYWKALCRRHHDWVGMNPEAARQIGLLCEKGKWLCDE